LSMERSAAFPDLLNAGGMSPDPSLSPPLQALWWLKAGAFKTGQQWETAHQICQAGEGDHAHDLVHALAHWIEGDEGNARYWYRRVGEAPAATIAEEWERIAKTLAQA
jgi:hypothetical protein